MPTEATKSTLKALGALSGNVCAFPRCVAPIYDTTHGKLVGQVCHIKAENSLGPRFDSTQDDAERHGLENLLFMCRPHHAVIEDPGSLSTYTVEYLLQIKHQHESRSHNTILTADHLNTFVEGIRERIVASAQISRAEPVIAPPRLSINSLTMTDRYDLVIRLHNTGEKKIKDFRVEVEIPEAFGSSAKRNSVCWVSPEEHGTDSVELYRTGTERWPNFALYPKNKSTEILMVDFDVKWQRYEHPITESILISVYDDDSRIAEAYFPIESLVNPERVAAFRALATGVNTK